MFEVIAYYDDNCKKVNLLRLRELYLQDSLPAAAADNFQYVCKKGFLDDVLKDFGPTRHILVRYFDSLSNEYDEIDGSEVQKILDRPYRGRSQWYLESLE